VSVRTDVLLWAQRIVNKKVDSPPTQMLEIRDGAGLEEAQAAFHKIAKMAHPDLHRNSLSPEELEMVTTAYARVANAYQELRGQKMQTNRLPVSARGGGPTSPTRPPETAGAGPASQMTSKALVYYRKAELSLRRGDLKGAVLQLKMAIAADPLSQLLRSALSEVESEIAKGG